MLAGPHTPSMPKLFSTPALLSLGAAFLLASCGEATEVGEDNELAVQPANVDIPEADYGRSTDTTRPGETEVTLCNADLARPYVGERVDAETRGRLLSEVAPLVNVRWLGPDEAAGEETDPERLTVTFDEEDKIIEVECG